MTTKLTRHLVWRDGRPRWEPSPTARSLGFKGRDLKDEEGNWLPLAEATAAAEEVNRKVDELRAEVRRRITAPPEDPTLEALPKRIDEIVRTREARRWKRIASSDAPSLHKAGYIYFLWAGDAVKIGFSVNPLRRLTGLETGVSAPIARIAIVPGTLAAERRLHNRFHKQRSHGEWFRATKELNRILMDMIEQGTANIP
ncbi:T5orf172 domain protein [Sinorhizobium sp. KGO-5]|uniref:GIY-YIG nuclease family protein n=1 Tax=Sinorhizobium sp. KGO-5 TaxID=1470810 RepID=UPI00294A4180|nr:T5orf172 domain protein [Sinorhizobium sp. KGO-5]